MDWAALQLWLRDFFFNWQTLIGGVFALIAAWIALKGVQAQIRQSKIESDRLRAKDQDVAEREEQAAKAILPLALSELSQYAEDCIRLLSVYVVPATRTPPQVPDHLDAPEIPPGAIEALQNSIRHAKPEHADKMAALIMKLQVQHSRLSGDLVRYRGRQFSQLNGTSWMIDAADVYASVATLYAYARKEDSLRTRSPAAALYSALANCGIHEDSHPARIEVERLANEERAK